MRIVHPTLGLFLRAVQDSFDQVSMTMLLLERFGLRYDAVARPGARWITQVIEIHEHFNMCNRTEQLVAAVRDARPDVPELAIVADSLGFTIAVDIAGVSTLPRQALEVLVNRPETPFQDVESFRGALCCAEAAICQVAMVGVAGTGSLIGRDIVITNHHVIAGAVGPAGALTGVITCRFDYKSNGAGYSTPAKDVRVRAILASRPHAEQDLVMGPMATDAARLDYALLKLDSPFADEPLVAGGGPRGHLRIDAPPATVRDTGVLVLQHPQGAPMKIDIGSVTEVGGTRFRHTVNTQAGSSGAPVLDAGLRMVGIHHAGFSNGPGSPLTVNQAIPLGAILADARAQGVAI